MRLAHAFRPFVVLGGVVIVLGLVAQFGCGGQQESAPPAAATPGARTAPAASQVSGAGAQAACPVSPEPITCSSTGGYGFTVIELHEDSGSCTARIAGGDKLETLFTTWGAFPTWSICNRCSQAVDVRLRNWEEEPQENFVYTRPPWDVAGDIELLRVCSQGHGAIDGLLKNAPEPSTSKSIQYFFSWRVSGQLAWTDIDPRLEIERDRAALVDRLLKFWVRPPAGK
jgi:hypothetical protein